MIRRSTATAILIGGCFASGALYNELLGQDLQPVVVATGSGTGYLTSEPPLQNSGGTGDHDHDGHDHGDCEGGHDHGDCH